MNSLIRHPRLITLLRHQCSLTLTEAAACLDRRESEASLHYGGVKLCLQDAVASRKRLYKQFNRSPLNFWFTRRDINTLRNMGF